MANRTVSVPLDAACLLVTEHIEGCCAREKPVSTSVAKMHVAVMDAMELPISKETYASEWGWPVGVVERNWHLVENKKRKRIQPSFAHDSWQYTYAVAFQKRLTACQIKRRAYEEDPEKTLQSDAAVFDKLNRLDGHSPETIRDVVVYLFGSWYIETKNVQSPKKLRNKKDEDGSYLFDRLLVLMTAQDGAGKPSHTDKVRDTTAEALEIIRAGREDGVAASVSVHREGE